MRILMTGHAGYSHLVPFLLPAAAALRSAGHEVRVAVPADGAHTVTEYGIDVIAVDDIPAMSHVFRDPMLVSDNFSVADYVPSAELGGMHESTDVNLARAFVGVIGYRMAIGLRSALGDFVPELVVRDNTEFAGHLIAALLDCPEMVLDVAPMVAEDTSEMVEMVNEARVAMGLTAIDALPARPRLAQTPVDFYPPDQVPERLRCFRPGQRQHEPLDPAIADIPADRPLVLATLGSVGPNLGFWAVIMDKIVEALGQLDVYAVVATGQTYKPGTTPVNVTFTEFVDQRTVLPQCDVFITHGGYNGVRESLQAGVPMVLLPLFGDHPQNSAQAERLGAGVVLDTNTVDVSEISSAVATIFGNPEYRYRARYFARRTLALPELGTFPERLTDMLA